MTQVICPGCAKLIEVGVLPPGTLPACPFCRTVFQLAGPSPGPLPGSPAQSIGRAAQHLAPGVGGDDASDTVARDPAPSVTGAAAFRRRTGLGIVVLLFFAGFFTTILLLAIVLLAHRDRQRDAPQDAAAAWQPVAKYSGHTHMLTPLFRIQSPVWRLTWACTANETPTKKSFQVRVLDDHGKLIGTPVSSAGDERQATRMETEPGMYLLDIRATNVEWQLTVEHQPLE